ncbi:hypothetical protein IFM89_016024 [Coptis chinensis]|uniref:PCI domain-containing protein n=1 Tax=Coptis chinensis TaxID=261450 RepID=A0A835H8S1_9MAGN|nr:hypothetical protein IFM89_016024 [Coptis chinensis]
MVQSRLKRCIGIPNFSLNVETTLVQLTFCISTGLYAQNSDRNLSALWGKLAAEILMQNWAVALEELNHLREIIDAKNFQTPVNQLQIDKYNFRYLNAIQTNAPHLLRYLATALIITKKRRPQLKEFIKVIQQEQYSYKDPITEFLQFLYVNYDFDGAQQKLRECEDKFSVHSSVFSFKSDRTLAEKLNMTYDEDERWIVNLVRNPKLDAKIDSKLGTVVMEPNHVNVYEQIIENTKAFSLRTYKYANLVLESAQVQTAVRGAVLAKIS